MATNQNSTIKWQARAAKLAKATTIASLKPGACEQRARYAASIAATIEAETILHAQQTIFCSRTGIMLGSFNAYVTATVNQLPQAIADGNQSLFNQQKFYHPAWLNLTPEILAQLQHMFPAAFIVYAAHELQHDDGQTTAEQRAGILDWLLTQSPELLVETAELLRRILAIVGAYRSARTAPASNCGNPIGLEKANAIRRAAISPPTIGDASAARNTLASYVLALRDYFAAAVKRLQAEHHVQSVYRQKQVTLSDVRRISATVGRQQFKLARDKTINHDNAAFSDVAEIFADSTDLEISITSKQMAAYKIPKFSGNVHGTETGPAAPIESAATPAPASSAAPVLKIKLFR